MTWRQGAVSWVEDVDGFMVVLTRGEYKESIKDTIRKVDYGTDTFSGEQYFHKVNLKKRKIISSEIN